MGEEQMLNQAEETQEHVSEFDPEYDNPAVTEDDGDDTIEDLANIPPQEKALDAAVEAAKPAPEESPQQVAAVTQAPAQPAPAAPEKPKVPETMPLELLQVDIPSSNHHRYSKLAVEDAMNNLRHDQAVPVARKNDQYNSKDIMYIRKKDFKFDEKTGILSIIVPVSIVQMAPGYYAVPIVHVLRAHDILDKDRNKVRVIDRFRWHEIQLGKEENAFPGLNSRLAAPKA